MHRRTSVAVAASVVAAAAILALAGCAVPTGPAATTTSESPAPNTPAPTTPAPPTPAAADAAPASASPPVPVAGAYVDYTDGAIEATAGAKALFFHASWCPQCRALDEDLRAAGVPDGLTVFRVDYDSRTDLRQRYGVTIQTTIVFVDDAGAAISSVVLYDDPSVASLVAAMPG